MTHKSRILIVDDEPAIAQLLVMLLGTHGYDVESVRTGREALAVASSDVDLILLDKILPDDNGLKICQLLKSGEKTRHIPIIIINASDHNGDRMESIHLGADDYLTLPLEPEELFMRVEVTLRRHHAVEHDLSNGEYEIIHELKRILDGECVVPFFQPIYHFHPFRLFGLEVLGRPQTEGVLRDPELLFKAALRFGMYCELELLVWRKAIEIAKRSLDHEHLFLNCSPHLIESGQFQGVKSLLQGLDMDANRVFLELTERSAISEQPIFFERLMSYREHGFKIAIDDVGAGYASLESIIRTKPEVIKVDRQIVKGLAHDPFKRSIIKLIVAFCRENSIICIAEGIEHRQDYHALLELGVQSGQGYYFFRPTGQVDLNAMRTLAVE